MSNKQKILTAIAVGITVLLLAMHFGSFPIKGGKEIEKQTGFEGYSDKLLQRAESGDAEAQYNIGNCYFYGLGVKKDYKKAVKWFHKSAEQGNASAANDLGTCYHNGFGVEQDEEEAKRWWRKAVGNGQ